MRHITIAAVGLLWIARPSPAADVPCTVATKGNSPVAQACAKGGRAEAKKVMKAAVKTAKSKGGKFDCDDCHKDTDNFELKPNAREDFKKLMALAGGTPPR
jgi:hypothetical protein